MLNGLYPILIINLFKLDSEDVTELAKIPLLSSLPAKTALPTIPIYLSQDLTGLIIDTEDKSIEIVTSAETLKSGEGQLVDQKGLESTVKVNLIANRDSIGLTILSALSDVIYEKATSKEYSVTYLSGPVTIFNGLFKSFNIIQNSQDTKIQISFEIYNANKTTVLAEDPLNLEPIQGALPVNG